MEPVNESSVEESQDVSATLERVLRLEEENNKMLKRMQIVGRVSFWAKVVVWSLILGLPVLFFKPLVEFLRASANQGRVLYGIPSSEQIQDAIQAYTNK